MSAPAIPVISDLKANKSKLKPGESTLVSAIINGNPKPTIVWSSTPTGGTFGYQGEDRSTWSSKVVGNFTIKVTATNTNGSASETITITVGVPSLDADFRSGAILRAALSGSEGPGNNNVYSEASITAHLSSNTYEPPSVTYDVDPVYTIPIASASAAVSISDNNSKASFVKVQNTSLVEWQSFIKFDLSVLPAGAPIAFASLVLTSSLNNGTNDTIVTELREVKETWTASGLTTWAGRPKVDSTTTDATTIFDDTAFIVTDLVQKWRTGLNFGVRLSQITEDPIERRFYAYSSIAARRPKLIIMMDDVSGRTEYGSVVDLETKATGNPDLYNSRLLQFNTARPLARLSTFGMIYLNRADNRISADPRGGWRTLLHTDRPDDEVAPRTLGTGRYQAASYDHTHS